MPRKCRPRWIGPREVRDLQFTRAELEFGEGGRHLGPRFGLVDHGPLQPIVGDTVRIGVIGTGETIDGFNGFIERAMLGIDAHNPALGNLHPGFPGLGNRNPFRCRFVVEKAACQTILGSDVKAIQAAAKHTDAVRLAVDLFADRAKVILEGSSRPDVIVLALPTAVIDKVVNAFVAEADEEPEDDIEPAEAPGAELNFRDMFKARALALNVPTQIVWPTLWNDDAKISRKLKDVDRKVQDPATRASHLLNAIFYKAGKAPWRLPHSPEGYATSYIGIGFYRDLDGHQLWTSTAQMFDERGRGLILRGARARTDRPGKHPYLTGSDAYELVKMSLAAYRAHHMNLPARLVILKTSRFEAGEADGFNQAISEAGVAMTDMVWVPEGGHAMLLRDGDYPPLRGSVVHLGKNALIYTRGSVPYYGTYPGARVPRPLLLRPHECDTSLTEIASEVLALTKMNWNSTQFDQALPIPIRAAREVGRVLRHVSYGERDQSDYRYYI